MKPGFADAKWEQAPAGFGTANFTNRPIRTAWTSPEIWIRLEVVLAKTYLHNLVWKCWHESDVEVYFNGVLGLKTGGRNADYEELDIKPEAAATLRTGRNLVAVHIKQNKNENYIDVGLVREFQK